ncbi:MAG TPA: helix-turn-helix domain-containing protein [Polyangiaceae bacterium]|nr:helix-turn-helix domain-containing protein [Polyangiaceae bacterium]
MPASAVARIAPSAVHPPSAVTASVLSGLLVDERDRDTPGLAIPRPETQLVVRFGASGRTGVDVHAVGVRRGVHRKLIHRGQLTLSARLHPGASQAVLGVPASAIAGRIVRLDELWSGAPTQRLLARLASAHDAAEAAAALERAIAERLPLAQECRARVQLVRAAASQLTRSKVSTVAAELGVSERHLRRAFHEGMGMSPKAFAQLERFQRALHAARTEGHASWASIAAATGYYDQAHLIAEFRAIAGLTPRALLSECRATQLIV